jgi:hypothetical protein
MRVTNTYVHWLYFLACRIFKISQFNSFKQSNITYFSIIFNTPHNYNYQGERLECASDNDLLLCRKSTSNKTRYRQWFDRCIISKMILKSGSNWLFPVVFSVELTRFLKSFWILYIDQIIVYNAFYSKLTFYIIKDRCQMHTLKVFRSPVWLLLHNPSNNVAGSDK